MRAYYRTGRRSGVSVGPLGMVLIPLGYLAMWTLVVTFVFMAILSGFVLMVGMGVIAGGIDCCRAVAKREPRRFFARYLVWAEEVNVSFTKWFRSWRPLH